MENQYKETSSRDWVKTSVLVFLLVLAIAAGGVLLLPSFWYVWLAIVGISILLLVVWHSRSFAYRCPKCGTTFEISALTDFITPQGMGRDENGHVYGWKYLKCPGCQRRERAVVVSRDP